MKPEFRNLSFLDKKNILDEKVNTSNLEILFKKIIQC